MHVLDEIGRKMKQVGIIFWVLLNYMFWTMRVFLTRPLFVCFPLSYSE